MTSVFASIVRPPQIARRPSSSSSDSRTSMNASQLLVDIDAEQPALRDLNGALQALTEIFPNIQPEVFREMLNSFSEESRLQVVAETLLKHDAKWVRGRYRMPAEQEQEEQREGAHKYKYRTVDQRKDTRGKPLALEDTFRSRRYCEAAKEALYHEFKGLSHSTIKAVMAEYNWSYTQARPTLLVLSSKSWRSSITNFFMRRRPPNPKDHPLVMWSSADPKTGRPRMPLLVKTRSKELDQELYDTIIVPELDRQRKEQVEGDLTLAHQLNEADAEEAGEMYDCECCFMPNTLEKMATCDVGGHYICFRCIRHSINAALYDQGWNRNIDTKLCTLRCIAPIDGVHECSGCVNLAFVRRALLEEKDGADTFKKLNERFSGEALTKSRLPLVQCPSCPYSEVDDLALPENDLLLGLRLKRLPIIVASVPLLELLCFQAFRFSVSLLILFLSVFALVNHLLPNPFPIMAPFRKALRRIHLKRRGLRFQCLSPTCHRTSCVACQAPWHDPHICYSSQVQSLRLALERATTDAVKRTCPQCNLGFVKSEGCNKLVCLCGYSMCYVCRQGLAVEGYKHFCQHFRERPGERCRECEKCDLYRVEDEEVVMQRAKERAETEWWESQGGGTKMKEGVQRDLKGWNGRGKSWESWVEKMVDGLVV